MATTTQQSNLQNRWLRLWQDTKRSLERQAGAPVSDQAVTNRLLQTSGGQTLHRQIQRLQRQSASSRSQRGSRVVGVRQPQGPGGSQGQGQSLAERDAGDTSLQDLSAQFQQALEEANEANRERQQQIQGGFEDLIGDVTGRFEDRERRLRESLAGFGDAQRADINRQFNRLGARAQQDLVTRGLTGSTILPSVRTGVEEERARALANLGGQIQQLRLGQESQLSGDTASAIAQLGQNALGFEERINETGPDFSQLAALAQQLGLGNSGQGFTDVAVPPATGGSTQQGARRGTQVVGMRAPLASSTGVQGNAFPGAFIPGVTGGFQMPVNPTAQVMAQFNQLQQQAVLRNQQAGRGRAPGRQQQGGFFGNQWQRVFRQP